MGKLKYIVKRIKNMNYKNFFKTINDVHEKTNKNRVYLFFDMVICGFKYQAGYMDYQLFEMYKMNSNERKTIITRGKNNDMIKKYNNPKFNELFHNKTLFNEKFNEYLHRDWLLVNKNNLDEFQKFLKNKEEIMLKPIGGSCGQKIEKVKTKDFKDKELYKYVLDNDLLLVEEVAKQCKELSALHPSSINTVRVITLKGKVLVAYLRIGNHNNVVDNFNHGGLVVPVDVESGTIKFPAIDKAHNEYTNHPLTGEKIVGLKIPRWNKVIELCEDAAKKIPELGYVGWDVCVGEKYPLLIEGNEFPGHDIYQLPPHRKGNTGLYPIFEKAMEEEK